MKKFFATLVAVTALIMTACGGGSSTPSDVVKSALEDLKAEKYEQFVEHFYIEDESDRTPENMKALSDMIKTKSEPTMKAKGGFASFEVVSEEIAEDGKSATVKIVQHFGNGESRDSDVDVVLDENGNWKLDLDK